MLLSRRHLSLAGDCPNGVEAGSMHEQAHELDVPRAPLLAAGALVILALVCATAVRMTGVGAVHAPDAATVAARELLFRDRTDGGIDVLDAQAMHVIYTVPPETNGFLRGTMRGLARERKRQGVSADVPFRLLGRADGRLTLEDPGTQRRVDIESFGPTNAAVFSSLMTVQRSHL
jgi:putative photosynthetic complex assembly protein